MSFNQKDVLTIARAMIEPENFSRYNNDRGGDSYECVFCDHGHHLKARKIKHSTNCPVLVAQDLLTGE